MIYKTLHRKLKSRSSNMNLIENQEWTQVLWKGKQFLLHMWHLSCYSCYKPGDKSWMSTNLVISHERVQTWWWVMIEERNRWWLQWTEHITDILWFTLYFCTKYYKIYKYKYQTNLCDLQVLYYFVIFSLKESKEPKAWSR